MYFWAFAPFLRYVAAFSTGICLYLYCKVSLFAILWVLAFFVITFFVCIFLNIRYKLNTSLYTGIASLAILAVFGVMRTYQADITNDQYHISAYESPIDAFYGRVVQKPEKTGTKYKLQLHVCNIKDSTGWHHVTGNIWLYVNIDTSDSPHFSYGDKILVKGSMAEIKKPLNPYTFNYKRYSFYKGITHQSFVDNQTVRVIGNQPSNLVMQSALHIRSWLASLIDDKIPGSASAALIKAISLGQRDAPDKGVRDTFADAGVIHILAVSGLHVGILYQVLLWLFRLVPHFRLKNGVKIIVILVTIWFYAFITGLSPSILRASTMFSFILLGVLFRRESNIYNSLAISAFFLLCIDPFMLFQVGFQLSYLAVLGIVYLQPRIYNLLDIPYTIPDQLWKLSSVTLAAQIATGPLTVYYFNQFPGLFLITNLVAIPAAFVMLTGTFLLFVTGGLAMPGNDITGYLLHHFVRGFYGFLDFIQQFPYSTFHNIYISLWDFGLICSIIVLILMFFEWAQLKYWYAACLCLFLLSAHRIYRNQEIKNQESFTVYNFGYDKLGIDFYHGSKCYFFAWDKINAEKIDYAAKPNRLVHGIESVYNAAKHANIMVWKDKDVCIMNWGNKYFLYFNRAVRHFPGCIRQFRWDYIIINDQVESGSTYFHNLKCKEKIIVNDKSIVILETLSGNIHFLKQQGAYTDNINI